MKTYKLRYIYNEGRASEEHLFRCNQNLVGQFTTDSSKELPLDIQIVLRELGVAFYWSNNTIVIYPVDIKDIQL